VVTGELALTDLNRVFCTDDRHWFLTGNRILPNTNIQYFVRSSDQGKTWEVRTFDLFSFDFFNTLFFTDSLTGYIGGSGFIIKTVDGGKNWIDQTPPFVPDGPNAIFFPSSQTGIAVGNLGQILRTTNGGGVGFPEPPAESHRLLGQNYPNPFCRSTTIRWHLSEHSHVRLYLFDSTGRLVATLADGEFPEGEHAVVFRTEHQAPGIYYYQLITGRGSETRKLVIME
jgi:hypothetical protein